LLNRLLILSWNRLLFLYGNRLLILPRNLDHPTRAGASF
jgi:hypothetical protein